MTSSPNASRAGGQSNSSSLDFFARRFLAVTAENEAATAKLAAVDALIDQARKVSPSASMCVYVGDVERALGRRADAVRGIVGANDGATA